MTRRYDVPGVLLATIGLFSLVYGFTEAARLKNPDDPRDSSVQGWTDPSTVTWLVLAVVLLVAFVLWERRASNPMLPLRVVLHRSRGGSYLVFLFVGAGLYAMFLFLTYYFQVNLGYTPLQAGFAFLPVQSRDHPHRRSGGAAAPTARPQAADGAGPGHGGRRHAAADPDRPGHPLLEARPALR